jgi:pimeloyl-ACP methyl ester carboxylesterase
MRRHRWLLGVAGAITLLFVLGRPVAWTEAAFVVVDIARGGGTWWEGFTHAPRQGAASWPGGEGDHFTPVGQTRAALVLVPGAAALGRDEPRLQAMARTLARAGFAVVVPELPEVRRFALSRLDALRVATALHFAREAHPGLPLGVMAISYGVAPALIAATLDDLAPHLTFAVGIGGYRDAEAAIRFVTTGAFRVPGDAREFRVEPNRYGRWAFVVANAGRLRDPLDSERLQQIARRRWQDPDATIDDLSGLLGPDARAVLALVDNREPDRVTALIQALPAEIRTEIDGLNLALHDLGRLRGHLILVHGREDPMVPYSESLALAEAASRARTSLFIVGDIGHIEFDTVTLVNGFRMWRAVLALLDERSQLAR